MRYDANQAAGHGSGSHLSTEVRAALANSVPTVVGVLAWGVAILATAFALTLF